MAARVAKGDRKKYSATGDGRFPIKNKSQAESAVRLRGHAKSKKREAVLRRAAKFIPKKVAEARKVDK